MQTHPLTIPQQLDPLMEAIGDRRVVMLGEASHGTSEYYNWRKVISKRLIEEKGFNLIAVEGDWPDCYEVNRFVKGYPGAAAGPVQAVEVFHRWPTWMWGNWEVAALVKWMREFNDQLTKDRKVGFYGLDVYSLYDSLQQVLRYLEQNDGSAVEAARKAFRCFEPYYENPQKYARSTMQLAPEGCRGEVIEMLREIEERLPSYDHDHEASFNNVQNAQVAVNAEKYYRAMIKGGNASWNVRDRHMMDTLDRLLDFHGPDSKAIVWEHNTHIGDARATDMARGGMYNIGQLAREEYGEDQCYLVGFGSHRGSVIAGSHWGAPMKAMNLPAAKAGSWEDYLYQLDQGDCLLLSEEIAREERLQAPIPHRAVGVVYHPRTESFGNYVPSVIPERYDAFIFIEETEALHPLALHPRPEEVPETYPWEV